MLQLPYQSLLSVFPCQECFAALKATHIFHWPLFPLMGLQQDLLSKTHQLTPRYALLLVEDQLEVCL